MIPGGTLGIKLGCGSPRASGDDPEDSKSYQAFDGICLEKAVVEGSRLAINANVLPEPKK